MLPPTHQMFCEAIISGMSRTDAYASSHPRAKRTTSRTHGAKLFRKPQIQAEIARLRGAGDDSAGTALLSNVEIRAFLARVIRSDSASEEEPPETEETLPAAGHRRKRSAKVGCSSVVTVRDKLMAAKLASDLAPPPVEPGPDPQLAAFHEMIRRIRSRPWRTQEDAHHGNAAPIPSGP